MKQLTKVHIKKSNITVEWYETIDYDGESKNDNHFYETERKPHTDLLTAFNRLRSHVKNICNLGDVKGMAVKGMVLSGMDTDEGAKAMFIVQVTLPSGKIWSFNTPLTSLFSEDDYTLAAELDKATSKVCKEAKLLLEEGKCAPNPQMEMELK